MGKKILAALIDFVLFFFVLGYLIATIFGQTTPDGGFELTGIPFLIWIVSVVAYFMISKKKFGQSLGRKILGIKVEKKKK